MNNGTDFKDETKEFTDMQSADNIVEMQYHI